MSNDIIQVIPKFINTFQNLLGLYEQKSRGATIGPTDFIAAFQGISKNDIEQAVKVFQAANNTRKTFKELAITQPSSSLQKELVTLPDQTKLQTASHVMEALVKTATQEKYPSADELLNTLQIKDKETKKQFYKVYEKAIKDTQNVYKKNPIDANLYRWAKFGQFFFYGGTVLLILIILWKIYEGIIYVTRAFRRTLADFIAPKGKMSYLKLWHWSREKSRKSSQSQQPSYLFQNIQKQSNIYGKPDQFKEDKEEDDDEEEEKIVMKKRRATR